MTVLDHIGVNVPDLDEGARWYAGALGLVEEMRFEVPGTGLCGVMLRHPSGFRIEVLSRAGSVPGMQPEGPIDAALTWGFSHFALRVPFVCAAYDELLAHGARDRMSPREAPGPPYLLMAFLSDPWGNLIELLER